MTDEIEVPTEHLQEVIHEAAEHPARAGSAHGMRDGFTLGVALSSALLAVLAALAALFAGHFSMDAMLERIEASNKWAHYQAKAIKGHVLRSKVETLQALGKPVKEGDTSKLQQWRAEQGALDAEARQLTTRSEVHLAKHTMLAACVTFFQIAIALGAIAVLTKRRWLWVASLAVGLCGAVYMTRALAFPVNESAAADSAEDS